MEHKGFTKFLFEYYDYRNYPKNESAKPARCQADLATANPTTKGY